MTATWLAAVALVLAAVPAATLLANLRLYRPPRRRAGEEERYRVSVLIPARDEERNIEAAMQSVLANRDVELELLVLDDGSTDATPELVRSVQLRDARVRLVSGRPLPAGANGKQHACAELARQARHEHLVFMDADVRLAADALGRMISFLKTSGAKLASGIPRQETVSWGERLIVPLVHFVLLAFLPLRRMRNSRHPAYSAGIGQLFVTERLAYERAGGHRAILASRHDGLDLPRAFRRQGMPTDLFDASDVAACRMYQTSGETWRGFLKNADQGLGHPAAIVPATAMLVGGQIAPWLLLLLWPWLTPAAVALAAAAAGVSVGVRWVSATRFRQPLAGALWHPVGVAALIGIQWHALLLRLMRRPARWKGRSYDLGGEGDAARAPASTLELDLPAASLSLDASAPDSRAAA